MPSQAIRPVGKSSLAVTPFGFGGGTIGSPNVSVVAAIDTVASAWSAGVRFFDTAPWYGLGRSERRLGVALANVTQRDAFRLNTKIGKTLVPEPVRDDRNKSLSPGGEVRTPRDPASGFRVRFEYTYGAIHRQHEDSLQRLGFASVDSLTIHDIDYGYHDVDGIERHLAELRRDGGGGARALEELRASGRIQAIGCGCNLEARNAWSWDDGRHEDLCERIADLVDLDFFVVAGGYTLLETRALRRILPFAASRGIGVIIAAPFASGWLVDGGASSTLHVCTGTPRSHFGVHANDGDRRGVRGPFGGSGAAIRAGPPAGRCRNPWREIARRSGREPGSHPNAHSCRSLGALEVGGIAARGSADPLSLRPALP